MSNSSTTNGLAGAFGWTADVAESNEANTVPVAVKNHARRRFSRLKTPATPGDGDSNACRISRRLSMLVSAQAVPLSQVAYSSASAALPFCVFLSDLDHPLATQLLALQLAATLGVALVRAFMLEPALSIGRTTTRPISKAGAVTLPAIISIGIATVCAASGEYELLPFTILVFGAMVGDSLRYVSWSNRRYVNVLTGDLTLALGSLVSILLFSFDQASDILATCVLGTTYAAWIAILVGTGTGRSDRQKPVPLREAASLGKFQVLEQGLGLAALQLPAILFAADPLRFGFVRLSQSLLGPLNTLQQALGTKILTSTRRAESRVAFLALLLGAVSLLFALGLGGGILTLGSRTMAGIFAPIAIVMVFTAFSGPFIYELRANSHQRRGLMVRLVVTTAAAASTLLAWVISESALIALWYWAVTMALLSVTLWPFAATRRRRAIDA